MNNIYFTSDTHLFHRNIMKFCPKTRPFESVEEMNEAIIETHNKTIKPNDIVWFLGDISFAGPDKTLKMLKRLNGKKHLIIGNHDDRTLSCPDCVKEFAEIHDVKMLRHNGMKFWLSHYPHRSWRDSHHGSFHLFGHVHGALMNEPWGRSMDVGLDTREGLVPYHVDEVVALLKDLEFTNGSRAASDPEETKNLLMPTM